MAQEKTIRIGCASAFWGDSATAALQFLREEHIDYIVFDYLAEVTMALLARARARSPAAGFTADFVDTVAQIVHEAGSRGIRIVSNAGGSNPLACAAAVRKVVEEAGLKLKVTAVVGDDLMDQRERLAGVTEMFSGAELPATLASMNAYLGALPVAAALNDGADIVITGRCVDSAVTLGALIHEFGWHSHQYDLLAAGSLAGHLLECGAQATGGAFTDWESVPEWDNLGYPVAECQADGRLIITKARATGGMVTPATVAEQLLYEIGNPGEYLLPDVTCDFRQVRLEQAGPDRVAVTGARGMPPTDSYKVSATYAAGYRMIGTLTIIGSEATRKARRTGEALLTRMRRMYAGQGWADFADTSVEVLGAEDSYGATAQPSGVREVVLKVGVRHPEKRALELFSREFLAGAYMAQGTTGFFAGRPSVSPVFRLFSCLVPKWHVVPTLVTEADEQTCPETVSGGFVASVPEPADTTGEPDSPEDGVMVRLLELAHARSGDKGDTANIGVIARRPEFWPAMRDAVTPHRVARYFAHFLRGPVECFELPGTHALNFLLHNALGGGGITSVRIDPQGKAFGQMLLDMYVPVPLAFARRHQLGGQSCG